MTVLPLLPGAKPCKIGRMGEMVEIGTGENALPVYQSTPGLDIKGGITANAKRCFDYLKGNAAVAGRIAVTGFSFGGTYAWSLAVHEPALKAAVPFYGHANFSVDEFHHIGCPVLAFYGERDTRLIEKLPEVEVSLQEAGISFDSVIYPNAGHAFFNRNPKAYNEAAATDAWNRSLAFLDRHLN